MIMQNGGQGRGAGRRLPALPRRAARCWRAWRQALARRALGRKKMSAVLLFNCANGKQISACLTGRGRLTLGEADSRTSNTGKGGKKTCREVTGLRPPRALRW